MVTFLKCIFLKSEKLPPTEGVKFSMDNASYALNTVKDYLNKTSSWNNQFDKKRTKVEGMVRLPQMLDEKQIVTQRVNQKRGTIRMSKETEVSEDNEGSDKGKLKKFFRKLYNNQKALWELEEQRIKKERLKEEVRVKSIREFMADCKKRPRVVNYYCDENSIKQYTLNKDLAKINQMIVRKADEDEVEEAFQKTVSRMSTTFYRTNWKRNLPDRVENPVSQEDEENEFAYQASDFGKTDTFKKGDQKKETVQENYMKFKEFKKREQTN